MRLEHPLLAVGNARHIERISLDSVVVFVPSQARVRLNPVVERIVQEGTSALAVVWTSMIGLVVLAPCFKT